MKTIFKCDRCSRIIFTGDYLKAKDGFIIGCPYCVNITSATKQSLIKTVLNYIKGVKNEKS